MRDPNHFTGGRPHSAISFDLVERLKAEFAKRKFNVSRRARELGIKPSTLAYHLRGGKVSVVAGLPEWRRLVRRALSSSRAGNDADALQHLTRAVETLKKTLTPYNGK